MSQLNYNENSKKRIIIKNVKKWYTRTDKNIKQEVYTQINISTEKKI